MGLCDNISAGWGGTERGNSEHEEENEKMRRKRVKGEVTERRD